MEFLVRKWTDLKTDYDRIWDLRDTRVDGYPLLGSPLPCLVLVALYVYLVKVAGPNFMKDRPPMNLTKFLAVYNTLQIIFSAYVFLKLMQYGWWNEYSYFCQPVDYSMSPRAIAIMHLCYAYYISKFVEFTDTFCFVLRKKTQQVTFLHVVHHGIMPISVWAGMRFVPGGHASFFGLLNCFIHFLMYFYYLMASLGPRYQKYIWWKRYLTTLQLVQFVMVFIHGVQLLFYEDCGFPKAFGYYIAAHAVLFFVLFSQYYVREYLVKDKRAVGHEKHPAKENGHAENLKNGYGKDKSL